MPVFAGFEDAGVFNSHTARIAASGNDQSYYVTRVGADIDYKIDECERIINIIPFFEYQHNLDTEEWWRKELGVEFGSSFFNDWFYYGASFQHIWQQEENYPIEEMDETTEWESRFVITPQINWWKFKDVLTLHLFNEYTYDFTRGQATFNEVGATIDCEITEWLTIPLGWRHVDRVHDYDADLYELSVLLSF